MGFFTMDYMPIYFIHYCQLLAIILVIEDIHKRLWEQFAGLADPRVP